MLARIRKLSFQKKILCSYILFIGISCVLFGIFYVRSMSMAKKENTSYMQQFGKQVSLTADVLFSHMDRFSFLHMMDDQVRQILRTDSDQLDYKQIHENDAVMQQAIGHMVTMNQYVLRATIITGPGDRYSNIVTDQGGYLQQVGRIDEQVEWDDKMKAHYTTVYESSVNLIRYHVVTRISKMYETNSDEPVATAYIDFNFDKITEMFDETYSGAANQLSFFLVDENGACIYSSPDSSIEWENGFSDEDAQAVTDLLTESDAKSGAEALTFFLNGQKCMGTVVINETTGWRSVQYIPLADMYARELSNMIGLLSGMGVILVAAVILCILLARQISAPVQALSRAMGKDYLGNVELIENIGDQWQDELGQLVTSYNEMGRRINDSIREIYIYQLHQKQAELKMLQLQINPHFLYNTLNTISAIAQLEDVPEIVAMADSLSKLFQYNIKGKEIVPIQEEVNHVKHYLRIQSIRFPGRFEIVYDVDEALEHTYMLKFLIQPLVENSVQHAFPQKRRSDHLRISVTRVEDEDVQVEIWDDGVGIQPQRLQQINRELVSQSAQDILSDREEGIGLQNVNARIKNFYGDAYGIWVESEEGSYTSIRMKIRFMQNGEKVGSGIREEV